MSAIGALWSVIPPRRRRQLAALFGLMLLSGVAELASIGAIVPFFSLLAGQGEHATANIFPGLQAQDRLIAAIVLFAVAVIVAAAIRLVLQWATQRVVLGTGHELTVEIQRRTLLQPLAYHVQQHSSALIASLDKVQMLIFGLFLPIVQASAALLISAFIVAALLWIEPVGAAVVGAVLVIAYAGAALLTRRTLARAADAIGESYDERIRLVQDSAGGIRDIIIDASQPLYLAEFRHVDRRFARAREQIATASAAPRFIVEAVGMIAIAIAAAVLASRAGGLAQALPALGALALAGQRLLPLVQQLHLAWAAIAGNRAVLRDALALLTLPVPDERMAMPEPLPLRDAVRLEHVDFTYEGSRQPALTDVTLAIPRGARIAIVGPTGSGKSTLADIVMGLLEPTAGRVIVDGTPLAANNRAAWQRNIAHVPQAVFLTDTSIARNIALALPGQPIDRDRLHAAAEGAQLAAFVRSLPDGFETRVGERGVRLSGGQRQRIGIARALYKGASFLLFDEATNALDDETEAAVLESIDALSRAGRTVLIIAHRGSTIASCDRIVRLENGRVTQVTDAGMVRA